MMCAMMGWRDESPPFAMRRSSRIRRVKDLHPRRSRKFLSSIQLETLLLKHTSPIHTYETDLEHASQKIAGPDARRMALRVFPPSGYLFVCNTSGLSRG